MSELHKLLVEDDASHAHSYVWSFALRGFVNELEISGDLVGHGDQMPPAVASKPPSRGSVSIERLRGGAGWLMDALLARDERIEQLQARYARDMPEMCPRYARDIAEMQGL